MNTSVARLQVRLEDTEDDAEELEELTRQLRDELLLLEVDHVERVPAGEAPAGTRSGELAAVGALLVGIAGHPGLLPAVVDTVRGWLARVGQRSVKLQMDGDVLEVTGISSRQQEQLVNTWLARHAGEADS